MDFVYQDYLKNIALITFTLQFKSELIKLSITYMILIKF